MFLSSFEALRKKILDSQHIDSLLHLGPRTFDELSGEVVQNAAFVITKQTPTETGVYYRLIDGKSCSSKCDMFLEGNKRYVVGQMQFRKIPGYAIGYWLSNTIVNLFANPKVAELSDVCVGIQTGDNEKYIHYWFEIDNSNLYFECSSNEESLKSNKKWYPYNKGGNGYKWFGGNYLVVDWFRNGANVRSEKNSVLRNQPFYFHSCLTFPRIGSGRLMVRYSPKGALFDINGPTIYPKKHMMCLLGYLNSKVFDNFLSILCPTLTFQVGDIGRAPCISLDKDDIEEIVNTNILLSKQDWDAHETSWDFKTNELVALGQEGLGCITATINDEIASQYFNLEMLMTEYKTKWESLFYKLHSNEEELNRQFIEIYGLQDELTPDVPLNEVTILQQGEISIVREQHGAVVIGNHQIATTIPEHIEFNLDVIVKQLISYMVGVWMGRYRLDRPGLNIAHPDPTEEELAAYQYGPDNATLKIDDDAIIPILPTGAPFEDNLTQYIADFVRIVWGEPSQTDNLNFIEKCLGKKIDDYVQKDFWKDHKKMYQNRPIYWLFASKKGAFKALVYVHRMHPYTVEQIRSRYLLKYMDWLRSEAQRLEIRDADLTTAERRRLDRLRLDIEECEEYHERLQVVAEKAISIDLDNGIPANHALFGDVVTKLK